MRGLQARLPSSCEANPFKMKKCKFEAYERIESSMCALLETRHHSPGIPIQDLNQLYSVSVSVWWSQSPQTVDSVGD